MLWILRAREKKHYIRVDLKICVYKRKSFWRSIYSVDTKVVVWICTIYTCRDYEQFPLKPKRLWITRSTFSALFLGLVCVIGGPIASFSFIGGSGLRGPSSRRNRIRAGSTGVHYCRSSQYQRRNSFSKILQRSRPHESCSRLRLWRRLEAVPYFCNLA